MLIVEETVVTCNRLQILHYVIYYHFHVYEERMNPNLLCILKCERWFKIMFNLLQLFIFEEKNRHKLYKQCCFFNFYDFEGVTDYEIQIYYCVS